jgi:flagellar motor switch protein FliG
MSKKNFLNPKSFKAGPDEAAKMLASLPPEDQGRILEQLQSLDPKLAQYIKENLVQFEDLKYLTISMLQDFFKLVPLSKLALALRGASQELRDFFLKSCTKTMAQDLMDELNGPPRPIEEVHNAQASILKIASEKQEQGIWNLRPKDSDPMV